MICYVQNNASNLLFKNNDIARLKTVKYEFISIYNVLLENVLCIDFLKNQ